MGLRTEKAGEGAGSRHWGRGFKEASCIAVAHLLRSAHLTERTPLSVRLDSLRLITY
jgi:hypothetical protein